MLLCSGFENHCSKRNCMFMCSTVQSVPENSYKAMTVRNQSPGPTELPPSKPHLVALTKAVNWTPPTLVPTSAKLSNIHMHGVCQDDRFLATSILRESSSNNSKNQITTKEKQKTTLFCSSECNTWHLLMSYI